MYNLFHQGLNACGGCKCAATLGAQHSSKCSASLSAKPLSSFSDNSHSRLSLPGIADSRSKLLHARWN